MRQDTMEHPRVVSRDEWLVARKRHLSKMGWRFKWVSSYDNDFNFDYQVASDR